MDMELNGVIITKAIIERFMRKLGEDLPIRAHFRGNVDFGREGSKAFNRKG
jgi:hypothetical protein